MKKCFLLIVATVVAVVLFSSCKPHVTSDYSISWGIQNFSPGSENFAQEMEIVYDTFDQTFDKASFGTRQDHRIDAKSLSQKQIDKMKEEAKQLADEANEKLADQHFESSFDVKVWGFGSETEDLATYHYGE